MTIAQVQVDDAYWHFTQDPPGPIARGATRLDPPALPVGAGRGARRQDRDQHRHDLRARDRRRGATPDADRASLVPQALLGVFVGILPVAIGLMFYPALRGVGRTGMNFLLALTVGLLAFLLVDTIDGGARTGRRGRGAVPGPGDGRARGGRRAFLLLMAVGRRHGTPTGLALATYIALGIGLHNFGEGLAIGAAFAAGAAGLGTFLVLGFTLHNVTEGIGIAAPMLKERPPLLDLRRPDAAGRRPGGHRHVDRQPRLRAAMVGAGAGDRRRRDPAGHRRGHGLSDEIGRERTGGADCASHDGRIGRGVSFMYLTAMLVKV